MTLAADLGISTVIQAVWISIRVAPVYNTILVLVVTLIVPLHRRLVIISTKSMVDRWVYIGRVVVDHIDQVKFVDLSSRELRWEWITWYLLVNDEFKILEVLGLLIGCREVDLELERAFNAHVEGSLLGSARCYQSILVLIFRRTVLIGCRMCFCFILCNTCISLNGIWHQVVLVPLFF